MPYCECDPDAKRCRVCGVDDSFCGSLRPCPAIKPEEPAAPLPTSGPGTELKALLARVGITAEPDCSCNAMAAKMDAWGEECVEHMAEIVEHLRAQAEARGLPFLDAAGRALVRVAIARARRKAT